VDGEAARRDTSLPGSVRQRDLDIEALEAFNRPVYFALGGRSNPNYYGRMADRLATIFPDFTIETFPAPPLRPASPHRARTSGHLAVGSLAAPRLMSGSIQFRPGGSRS
jgi:hypothetical protein